MDDDHTSGQIAAQAPPSLEELHDAPLGTITVAEAKAIRPEIDECNANRRLHVLVGSDENIALAGAYRMRFFGRIDEVASVNGTKLEPDAEKGIKAAKRIRAASWWVHTGSGKPIDILYAANIWAAGRKAAKAAAGG